MKRSQLAFLIITFIVLYFWGWNFMTNASAEVKSFNYEIEEKDNELIIEVNFQITNNDDFRYATIVLDSFFYERVKNPESLQPIFLNGGINGFTRIIIDKEDLMPDFIENLINKEISPIRAISIGEEILVSE